MTDPIAYLTSIGLTAVTPNVRSSDETAAADPFGYFLRRRLGLVPALRHSPALSKGRALHTYFQAENTGDTTAPQVALAEDIATAEAEAAKVGIGTDALREFQDTLRQDYAEAAAWWAGGSAVRIPKYGTVSEFFAQPHFQRVSVEKVLVLHDPAFCAAPVAIQPDQLRLNTKTNSLWIDDLKSCSELPQVRAYLCPVEFQPKHYGHVLKRGIETGIAKSEWGLDLPADVTVEGVCHIIWQKPTIRPCKEDRPYIWSSPDEGIARPLAGSWHLRRPAGDAVFCTEEEAISLLTVTKGKKVTKPKQIFIGEPDPTLFAARCRQWYVEQARSLETLPLDISFTTGLFTDLATHQYRAQLEEISQLALRDPNPNNFPTRAAGMRSYGGRLSPYAPFYREPLTEWPEIIRSKKFVVAHRDSELPDDAG
jgi:hypothetical protein